MGEEWLMAMAFRFIKEALPVVIPPVWRMVRSAVVRTPSEDGATTKLEAIVETHTERLVQLQTELEEQRIVQMQLHKRIGVLSWVTGASAVLSLLAILVAIIVALTK